MPKWNSERKIWEWWYQGFTTYTIEYLPMYATSADGFTWERPELGLCEFNGNKANNVAHDSPDWNLCHLIRDETDEDERRRYNGLFSGDNLAGKVLWKVGASPAFGERAVRRQIRLRQASLYSFWIS